MYRLSSTMEIFTAACVLWHPNLIEASLIFSQLFCYYRAKKILKLAHFFCAWSLCSHSLQASTYFPDAIIAGCTICRIVLAVNSVFLSTENCTTSLILFKYPSIGCMKMMAYYMHALLVCMFEAVILL